ncbi:hypothetical protein ACFL0Q_05235 [Thermodesulfobacteriota bacterium]
MTLIRPKGRGSSRSKWMLFLLDKRQVTGDNTISELVIIKYGTIIHRYSPNMASAVERAFDAPSLVPNWDKIVLGTRMAAGERATRVPSFKL